MNRMIAGFILTGGKNRRMAGEKKLFLDYQGQPFWVHLLTALEEFPTVYLSVDREEPYASAGLPMVRALGITAKTIDNYYISTEVGKLTAKLEEGHALCPSMREADVLPDILVDMVGVGEETGEMENTLHTIAQYYDDELQVAIDAAMAKLEPTILVFLAGFAGFIVIAIYMAMFGMYAAM